MAWSEYITSIDCITNNIVEYHKLFFETYEKNKLYSEYNYNIWNNILTSYFIDNKSKWNTIIFHVYNIKIFSEKY